MQKSKFVASFSELWELWSVKWPLILAAVMASAAGAWALTPEETQTAMLDVIGLTPKGVSGLVGWLIFFNAMSLTLGPALRSIVQPKLRAEADPLGADTVPQARDEGRA